MLPPATTDFLLIRQTSRPRSMAYCPLPSLSARGDRRKRKCAKRFHLLAAWKYGIMMQPEVLSSEPLVIVEHHPTSRTGYRVRSHKAPAGSGATRVVAAACLEASPFGAFRRNRRRNGAPRWLEGRAREPGGGRGAEPWASHGGALGEGVADRGQVGRCRSSSIGVSLPKRWLGPAAGFPPLPWRAPFSVGGKM